MSLDGSTASKKAMGSKEEAGVSLEEEDEEEEEMAAPLSSTDGGVADTGMEEIGEDATDDAEGKVEERPRRRWTRDL